MTAKVPYLAALAGPPAPHQPPTLRPPRRLFADGVEAPANPTVVESHGPSVTAERREPAVTSIPVPAIDAPAEPAAQAISPPPPEPAAPATPDTRPLDSWTDPRWGMPVELPQTQNQKATEPQPPNLQPPAGDDGQPGAERQVPDLIPQAIPPSPPIRVGRDPIRERLLQAAEQPSQVSIGTIEVTVVPPPQPPAATQPTRPAPRPVSQLTAGLGADRMRDGLRRWHGIAQG